MRSKHGIVYAPGAVIRDREPVLHPQWKMGLFLFVMMLLAKYLIGLLTHAISY